jgi:integrase
MNSWPLYPVLYQINTWAWLTALTQQNGRQVTLGDVPEKDLDSLADRHLDAVWLMGVWQRSPESRRIAQQLDSLVSEKRAALAKVSDKQRRFIRSEAQRAVNAIRLIMVTGARKGEVLLATWDQFDLDRGVWTKPSHNTKQQRVEHVPLNDQAVAFLRSLPREGEYLFPGRMGGHLADLKFPWGSVCEGALLQDVRIHDLRHTYASHLVSRGVSLPMVGKLLGHTQPQTTARYAHIADNPLREAANLFPTVLVGGGAKLANRRNLNQKTKDKQKDYRKGASRKRPA